jgi:acyl-homoserine-lactone acylase
LEEVVEMKHSMKMLAADRLKGDLIVLMEKTSDFKEVGAYLDAWDNTSAAESQGSVLFNEWFWNYRTLVGADSIYREPWDWEKPMSTPFGIYKPDHAVKAMEMAIDTLQIKYGSYKLAWGDVFRVRRGDVDVPVGGGSGTLGNFRVIYFGPEEEDGKRRVIGGDGWVFAVEFGKKIKAYSVLAYGQSNRPESPYFDDQAELFAENKMKNVAFSEQEIKKALIKTYVPGKE